MLWKEKSRNLREMQMGEIKCTIDGDGIYGHSCTILDADDEWVKLIVHEKKSDSTMIVRLDNIDSITLD